MRCHIPGTQHVIQFGGVVVGEAVAEDGEGRIHRVRIGEATVGVNWFDPDGTNAVTLRCRSAGRESPAPPTKLTTQHSEVHWSDMKQADQRSGGGSRTLLENALYRVSH